ncbi:hypothetical protein amb3315 [Paramagnetospirillum magneticum AMB-1]|uniref:Uncharacterized protein n=1 Tax=Paramagnetospirillum magneticum (strain ATCC 700264 / AMB-1) TaxID=342108 RepID=Q2W206_PARM1|nr:hypothetical protein amb3315 [Paramagnetospirillum magneticum AMB-1]
MWEMSQAPLGLLPLPNGSTSLKRSKTVWPPMFLPWPRKLAQTPAAYWEQPFSVCSRRRLWRWLWHGLWCAR